MIAYVFTPKKFDLRYIEQAGKSKDLSMLTTANCSVFHHVQCNGQSSNYYIRTHIDDEPQWINETSTDIYSISRDILLMENVQRVSMLLVVGMTGLDYDNWLKWLKLFALAYRRKRIYLITLYKVRHGQMTVKLVCKIQPTREPRTPRHSSASNSLEPITDQEKSPSHIGVLMIFFK